MPGIRALVGSSRRPFLSRRNSLPQKMSALICTTGKDGLTLPVDPSLAPSNGLRGESGITSVEYAVLAGFIIVVCAAAVAAFQDPAGSALANTGDSVGTYADP